MSRRLAAAGLLAVPLLMTSPPAHATPLPPAPSYKSPITFLTVPAVNGYPVRYQGRPYATDANGQVVLPPNKVGLDNAVHPLISSFPVPGGAAVQLEKLYGLGTTKLSAALSTFRTVTFTFSNLQRIAVPRSSLGEISVKSSLGVVTDLPAGSTSLRVQSSRVVPDNVGLEEKQLYYTVQRVDVQGNNVVNRSQTKFFPTVDHSVDVPLLFFDATVKARDALFGFGVGGRLVLDYPNGRSVRKTVGSGGIVSLPGLPRGQYHMSVVGPGLKIVQPVAMSREQTVDLKVFTWLDVATVVVVALGVAIGLVLLGRRFQRRRTSAPTGPPVTVDDVPPAIPVHYGLFVISGKSPTHWETVEVVPGGRR